jgi:hypothetical protein
MLRQPGASSLSVLFAQGWIARTSVLWDFDFPGASHTRKGEFYSCSKSFANIRRLASGKTLFYETWEDQEPKELSTVESHPCKERKDGAPGNCYQVCNGYNPVLYARPPCYFNHARISLVHLRYTCIQYRCW